MELFFQIPPPYIYWVRAPCIIIVLYTAYILFKIGWLLLHKISYYRKYNWEFCKFHAICWIFECHFRETWFPKGTVTFNKRRTSGWNRPNPRAHRQFGYWAGPFRHFYHRVGSYCLSEIPGRLQYTMRRGWDLRGQDLAQWQTILNISCIDGNKIYSYNAISHCQIVSSSGDKTLCMECH